MKIFGHTLIWIAFLVGAFLAVEQPEGLAVTPFVVALLVGAAGVALVRVGIHRETRHEEKLESDIATIRASLEKVVADAEALDRDKEQIGVYGLHRHIDETFLEDLTAFVQARESIAHSFGLQAYADVMSHFAAGERYLNRVWSASTDGYIDEAFDYVGRAHEQFDEALEMFRKVSGGAGGGAEAPVRPAGGDLAPVPSTDRP